MMNKRLKVTSVLWSELASTENINLAEDIWFEIFVFLPLSSIFKFKCVSKAWFSLLSNPYFINKWMKHNTSNKSVPWSVAYTNLSHEDDNFTYPKVYSPSIASLGAQPKFMQNKEKYEKLYAVGSCNGLVVFSPSPFNHITYFVCNPLTEKWVLLPPLPPDVVSDDCQTMTGFVCECFPSTNYQVVRIPKFVDEKRKFSIHIFFSDRSEWTICEVSCTEDISWQLIMDNGLVSHNGDLLWIANTNRVLAYNLKKNICGLIELPDDQEGGGDLLSMECLNVSEGLICYARRIHSSLSVWVLKDNWQLLHKDINLSDHILVRNIFSRLLDFYPLQNITLCDILERMMSSLVLGFNPVDKNVVLLGICNCVVAYNIETKNLEELTYRCKRNLFQGISQPVVLKFLPTMPPALSILKNHIV